MDSKRLKCEKRNTFGRSNLFYPIEQFIHNYLIYYEVSKMICAFYLYIRTITIQYLQMSYSRDSSYGRGRGRSYGGDASKSFNRGNPTTKPVEVGKKYEVDITEISRKGDGIARVQGFIVFIENGKVGNKIRVKVTEVADRFAKATVEI